MSATSNLGLVIAYWLHILATVVWIGGLAALSIFVLPAARRKMEQNAYSNFLTAMNTRLQQVGWVCLSVLIFTGLFQMVSHPNYQGFLVIDSSWALAILIKHLTVAVMLLLSIYVTWGLMPALQRAALMRAAGRAIDEAQVVSLQNREIWLLRANLILAVIVLLLTAWARSAK